MRIRTNQLKEGCILAADIKSLTNHPIVPKKTVISHKNLDIIKAFLVKDVQVEPILVNGDPFKPNEIIKDDSEEAIQADDVIKPMSSLYLKAVQDYKKLFKGWQANVSIDMPAVRTIVVPIIEAALETPRDIFSLYHYSTKEDYLYHHAITLAALSAVLGKVLNFSKGDCIQIGIAGAMCDCGMAKIDPKILNKKESLSKHEFDEVKKHPIYSFTMLEQVKILKDDVRKTVYQHHERIDGSGYPNGLTAEYIHPFAKIIAVSDVYHAMTSERNYRGKQSPFKVLESILQDQFGKFDPRVVNALTKVMTNFSSGTRVLLSNNEVGEIVFIEQKYPTRPMIKLESTGEIIQLIQNRQLFIEEVL
ncbi:HD-GYP domain-containing protein [Calidifontibacillus oryziterrae]|uniref:HD-GYP domain-containing protein n=1 Tax=Calidifontibacillus oryziterrae TaxID=1191699 RepID=UPI00031E60FF|nr:HD-GYP domain-containing protein [Calidifontibacillus oryziterrae]